MVRGESECFHCDSAGRDIVFNKGKNIMKMKYFRFLFTETSGCLTHFGELEEAEKEERFSFLYLRGVEKQGNQRKSEQTLFLCPEYVDLVVLGQVEERTKAALRELLETTKIGTLVIPATSMQRSDAAVSGDQRTMSDQVEETGKKTDFGRYVMENGRVEIPEHLDGIERIVRLGKHEKFQMDEHGWKIYVSCWMEGALAMLHGVSGAAETECATSQIFDDCVMNVKRMDANKRCSRSQAPDGYGCAMGCVLHQDYDVCKYEDKEREMPWMTGTLLTAGDGSREDWENLGRELQTEEIWIRFFALEKAEKEGWQSIWREQENNRMSKRYYVGSEAEMSDKLIGAVCRDGFNQVPVALCEGNGICCSGLLHYAQKTAGKETEGAA